MTVCFAFYFFMDDMIIIINQEQLHAHRNRCCYISCPLGVAIDTFMVLVLCLLNSLLFLLI